MGVKDIGNCFEKHGKMVLEYKAKELLLVHGEVSGQQHFEGIRFTHCWLENDTHVYDYSNNRELVFPKEVYYLLGRILNDEGKLAKYTNKEAREFMIDKGTFGPWELTCKL